MKSQRLVSLALYSSKPVELRIPGFSASAELQNLRSCLKRIKSVAKT
jgi:hypothetical protein